MNRQRQQQNDSEQAGQDNPVPGRVVRNGNIRIACQYCIDFFIENPSARKPAPDCAVGKEHYTAVGRHNGTQSSFIGPLYVQDMERFATGPAEVGKFTDTVPVGFVKVIRIPYHDGQTLPGGLYHIEFTLVVLIQDEQAERQKDKQEKQTENLKKIFHRR